MSFAAIASLLGGIALGLVPAAYYIEVTRAYDNRDIEFPSYARHPWSIAVLLVGGGQLAGGVFVSAIIEAGELWWYLIGLNGLFFSVAVIFSLLRWLGKL